MTEWRQAECCGDMARIGKGRKVPERRCGDRGGEMARVGVS